MARVAEKSSSPLNVSARLATFTLVAVLKNQGLFEQALDVLDFLDHKGDNKKKVDQERKSIQTLLKNTQEDWSKMSASIYTGRQEIWSRF